MPRFNNVNGTLVQCTAEEETYFDALDQDFANTAVARASAKVREKRDNLLAETDWMANSDVTMPDAWESYRAFLRNVPQQAGFPDVTWPTKPGDT